MRSISVVIATTKPWPEVRPCLDSLTPQVRERHVEVIVADGSGHALPEHITRSYPEVVWLQHPGMSVFMLRGLAMQKAAGDIIAVTEDHCRVAPDWCERILAAHHAHPDAAAIGGSVENGATTRLMDWANYLVVLGPFMPPVRNGPTTEISLQANISYTRRVIPKEWGSPGMMEMLFNRELVRRGETLVADDGIVTYHDQTHGFFGSLVAHFHNGRSIAGYRNAAMGKLEWTIRAGGTGVLPAYLFYRTLRAIWQRRRFEARILASLPCAALLVCCHAFGELLGYLTGPGNSPRQLA